MSSRLLGQTYDWAYSPVFRQTIVCADGERTSPTDDLLSNRLAVLLPAMGAVITTHCYQLRTSQSHIVRYPSWYGRRVLLTGCWPLMPVAADISIHVYFTSPEMPMRDAHAMADIGMTILFSSGAIVVPVGRQNFTMELFPHPWYRLAVVRPAAAITRP